MNKILKKLTSIVAGVVALNFAAQKVSANQPYLASVGPTPLRYEIVTTNNALFLAELTLPRLKAKTEPPMPPPAPKPALDETNTMSPAALIPVLPATIASGPGNPASDMLNVTPQMIDEYFKPTSSDGGNGEFRSGQSIFVPAELRFVPPIPESRAIYISK